MEIEQDNGGDYIRRGDDVYKLGEGEWLTIKAYSDKYGKSIALLCQWIIRGIIPDGNWVEISELNNLKLIRDREYYTRGKHLKL